MLARGCKLYCLHLFLKPPKTSYGPASARLKMCCLLLLNAQVLQPFVSSPIFSANGVDDYNSVVATFCHNIARGLPVKVDQAAPLTLLYVDDLVERFIQLMDGADASVDADGFATVMRSTPLQCASLLVRSRPSVPAIPS